MIARLSVALLAAIIVAFCAPAYAACTGAGTCFLLDNGTVGPLPTGSLVLGSSCASNAVGCLTYGNASAPADFASTWSESFAQFGTTLSMAGTGSASSANQWGQAIQCNVPSTSSGASYEKACGIATILQTDPSSGSSIWRDAVGWESRCAIATGNATGRCWGGLDSVQHIDPATSDGILIGREIDIVNNGADVSSYSTTNMKVGLLFGVVGGRNPATYGIAVGPASGTNQFHSFIYADPSAITSNGYFLQLNGKFGVSVDGGMGGAYLTTSATPGGTWQIDTSAGQNLIANGASLSLAAGAGLIIIQDVTTNNSAIYLCTSGTCSMVFNVGGTFVASTTTPASTHMSVAYSGSAYAIYNNVGSTQTVSAALIRTQATP